MKRFAYDFLLPLLIAPLFFLMRLSWRIRVHGPLEIRQRFLSKREGVIYAHWHGDELPMVGFYSYRRIGVLSSLSDDGALMARTLQLLGYRVFRGSSSRGGARGLIGLIRFGKAGHQVGLAVDGPKGPIYEVKPGIVDLAARTQLPVVPLRAFPHNAWYFKNAWNKGYLPKPFSRVDIVYGNIVEPSCTGIKQGLDGMQAPAK